ncbi:MAG: VIT1/CCC1 transporter family protein [Candidatus Woesearchaeota archaeon]
MAKREVMHERGSAVIRDVILGGQDGLVNVLGIVLAVAEATQSRYIILISGLAATFAESISMAAVAYTSAKAGREFYRKKREEIEVMVKKNPESARPVLREMFSRCGLQGTLLNKAIQSLMSDKKRLHEAWVSAEMRQAEEFEHPVRDAVIVGLAAIVGSLVPLVPFIFVPTGVAMWTTLGIATLTLFASGAIKAKYTAADPFKSGLEMAVVGMTAAIAGYLIGVALGALPIA